MSDSAVAVTHEDWVLPVSALLTVGRAEFSRATPWIDYIAAHDLRPDHVPALISMACDPALNDADGAEVWAPVHAWRALAQLRAIEAVEPLLEFMRSPLVEDDDAVCEDFPRVFGMIGPAAIAPITRLLEDRSLDTWSSSIATGALAQIGLMHAESRPDCLDALVAILDRTDGIDLKANGFLIGALLDLRAVEAIEPIRAAYRRRVIDISIPGDLEDAEIALGLRERRATPKPNYPFIALSRMRTDAPAVQIPHNLRADESDWIPVREAPKVGRNDPCPCGSGKKFKKCCLQ